MHMIQALFPIFALAGGIICGLCLAMGNPRTSWNSTLGRWAIAGLLFLAIGMFGWMYNIKTMSETTTGKTFSPIMYTALTLEYTYGPMIKPNGHLGWGMRYQPKIRR